MIKMLKWPTKKLGEICQRYFSGIWGEEPKGQNLVKVIRVSDIKEDYTIDYEKIPLRTISSKYLERYRLETGDIIIVKSSGSKNKIISGRAAYFEQQDDYIFIPSNFILTLRISKEKATPKFIWYFLLTNTVKEYIKGIVEGTTYPNLNILQFLNLSIPLPPLLIQQKIVSILDVIQEAIDVQEKIIEKTKELKKSMMADLFKYGGPSFRKNRKLKKTEIGEIPENWEVVRLGEVVEKPQYGLTTSATSENTGIKLLRITDIQEEKVNWGKVPFCKCYSSDFEKYKIKPGDILIARIGATTGKTYFIEDQFPAVFGSYLIRIHPKSSLIANFLRYYFQFDLYWKQINLAKGGRLKGGINIPVIENLKLPFPSLPEQQEIADILQTIDQKIEIEQKKKELYEELFKTMLNKIFTGEIDVEKIKI